MRNFILALILTGATAGAAGAMEPPDENFGEMAAWRQRLLAALDSGAGARDPMLAARAEAGLECWTAGIEAGGATERAACREAVLETVAALERMAGGDDGGLMAAR